MAFELDSAPPTEYQQRRVRIVGYAGVASRYETMFALIDVKSGDFITASRHVAWWDTWAKTAEYREVLWPIVMSTIEEVIDVARRNGWSVEWSKADYQPPWR